MIIGGMTCVVSVILPDPEALARPSEASLPISAFPTFSICDDLPFFF